MARKLPIVYPRGKQEKSLYQLFRHYYLNHTGTSNLFSAYIAFELGDRDKVMTEIKECLAGRVTLSPKQLLKVCKRDQVLSEENIKTFSAAITELEDYYAQYMTYKNDELHKLLQLSKQELTADIVDNVKLAIDEKYWKIVEYFEHIN